MLASIARRYARALLEIAAAANTVDDLGRQLDALAAALEQSPELRGLFSNPAFSRDVRQRSFDAIATALGLAPTLDNLVRLLIERDRVAELPQIASIYRDLSDERAGRARAEVRAAIPLSAEQIREIESVLSKAVSRTVTAEARIDPELLGGAVAQVGSFLFDGSIKGQLRELRRELKRA